MNNEKNLLVCAAGDPWIDKVIRGLGDEGITSVPCKLPEELWETSEECLGILISLEEISSLNHWINIKDIYEQNQSPGKTIIDTDWETGRMIEERQDNSVEETVQQLCLIQDCPVIIVLSGRDDREEIACLQAGAAECVSMLRSEKLAVERIRRQLANYDEQADEILQWNCVILDRRKQLLHRGDRTRYLSGREFKVLFTLMQAGGEVVSRSRLAVVLWGNDGERQHRNLDVILSSLRSQLKDMGMEIVTRYGEGYYLREGIENK